MTALTTFRGVADALESDWHAIARPEQLAPPGQWFGWMILAGRGFGKTRTGAEWILEQKRSGARLMGLVGATISDVRKTMINGPSGICAVAPDHDRPEYEPSNQRIIWRDGAQALTFSAEEPSRLRGPQFERVWCDELCAWANLEEAWEQLEYGMRLGDPRVVVTTTPRPLPLLHTLMNRPDFRITRGSTYANRANLAPAFFESVIRRNEGTRLGRQEIFGEVLQDTPGALWTLKQIEANRVAAAPALRRIVVALDPAVTSGEDSDLTGIVAVALGEDGHGYVLADESGKYTPLEWASKAVALYWHLQADRIVGETNQGGDMVEAALRNIDPNISYKGIPARQGKVTRAEPVSALYEQGRVHHVGEFRELEAQLCSYVPGARKSPDRMDALVHGVADLMINATANAGMIAFMRNEAEKAVARGPFPYRMNPTEGAEVRIMVPPGTSVVMLMSGESRVPDAFGVVTVHEADARPLRAIGWQDAPVEAQS